MCIGRHVKYQLFLSDLKENSFFSIYFRKKKYASDIKFHENLSSGSRDFPYRQTEMTKLTVAYLKFW